MTHKLDRRQIALGTVAVVAVALLVAMTAIALDARAGEQEDAPEIIGFEAEMFAEGNAFPDDFRAEYRVKFDQIDDDAPGRSGSAPPNQDGVRETYERLVNDGSNVYMGRLTFPAEDENGGIGGVDWHTHPGPFLVAVTEGELTVTWESECEPRVYEAGEVFVDLGQRIHKAENFADEDTVVHFTVIGVPEGEPITNVVADDEDFEEPC